MQLVWTILIGFVAGLIAKILTPGTGPSGFWLTAALGVAGSILATYLGSGWAFTRQAKAPALLAAWSEPPSCWSATTF
jgi:uncharacterized membrane protein YeaQ/YmgE (transglycosylase-associated protein family)